MQKEDEEEKQPQPNAPAQFNARIKDSIATNIKVNEVTVTQYHHVHTVLVKNECALAGLPEQSIDCLPDIKA